MAHDYTSAVFSLASAALSHEDTMLLLYFRIEVLNLRYWVERYPHNKITAGCNFVGAW